MDIEATPAPIFCFALLVTYTLKRPV